MPLSPIAAALAAAVSFAPFPSAQEPQSPPAPTAPPAPSAPAFDPALLAGLKLRSIGPAGMSGRIGAVAGVPGDPTILWAGAASGGVWKSTDGGLRWTPVFDDQDCTSIGALAIDPRSPEVVWAGTGEGNPRNSASVGRGVYRTRDGGRTWKKLGLERTEHVHRVLLHPHDPEVAFVAAMGTTWGENEERGVFVTRDGGASWTKSLYVDPRTGCADLVMDARNPDKLFAAMWEHRRTPWGFTSGGPGSGLHRSLDGGKSWTKLGEHDGLPAGQLGRACFALSPSDPRVCYVLVESEKNALYRSDDGGFRWAKVNDSPGIAPRPFYFCDVRVDPADPNRLYNLHVVVDVSTDGGRTFQGLAGWDAAHPDHHALWIDPLDPKRLVLGNDGGISISLDRGASWRFCANLPLAQFYHVAVDHDVPWNLYGGLQDNGSHRGPSTVWENGGVRNFHWREVCFGDGFAVLPDPKDSSQGYAMSQGGALIRFDLRTGAQKSIRPPAPDGVKLRFHWNAALAQDPFDPAAIYYGSQFVHRSPDRGESWQVISPDLTTDNAEWQKQSESGGLTADVTGAENHCTLLVIAPSPVDRATIWTGSDDGRVHVTTDGGRSWTSVEQNVPGLPRNTWCPHVEPDRFDAAAAFAVFDGHRTADWTPYVYRTTDHGKTWTSLATKELDGYCLTIEQDPVREDLLFLGTEFGLYATLDGGASWFRWKHGVPTCSAMALAIHPTAGDLVLATHGRSAFVLDDLTPLRTLTPELLRSKLHVFAPQDAIAWVTAQSPGPRFPGHGEFRGETRVRGALLHVVTNAEELAHPDDEVEKERKAAKATEKKDAKKDAPAADPKSGEKDEKEKDAAKGDAAKKDDEKKDAKEPPKDHVTVEVRGAGGALVRTFRHPVKLGLNRIVWGLERDGDPGVVRELQVEPPELPPPGRQALPGDYEVTVRFQGEERRVPVRVLPDPRQHATAADRQAKEDAFARRLAIQQELRAAVQHVARARKDLELLNQRLALEPKPRAAAGSPPGTEAPPDRWKDLRAAAETFGKELEAIEEKLWGPKPKQGIGKGVGFVADVQEQVRALTGAPDRPNPTELLGLDRAQAKTEEAKAAVAAFAQGPLAAFRAAVAESGIGLAAADESVAK